MRIGVSLITIAMGLMVAGAAQSQSDVAESARGRSSAAVTGSGASGAAASQAAEQVDSRQPGEGRLAFEEGTELNAELTRRVDARRARPGDEVRAELTQSARSSSGIVLEKGTRLVGRVTEVRPHTEVGSNVAASAESHLAIVFDRAVVDQDHELPIHATIQALAAAEGEMQAAGRMAGARSQSSSPGSGSISGGGSTAGRALAGAGGISSGRAGAVGSLGGTVGGATGTVRGAAGAGASAAGHAAGSRTGDSIDGAIHAAGTAYKSGNAVGGIDLAGRFGAGSRGVFGIDGLDIVSRGAARAGAASRFSREPANVVARGASGADTSQSVDAAGMDATVITSASGNVRLDSGTRMLLVASGSAAGSASVSR